MRRGREFYSKNYEKVLELYNQGKSIKEISNQLNISYSCVYHWIKGLRKPDIGNINLFIDFIKNNGPIPIMNIKEKFPKHNELFLTASRRGLPIKRFMLGRKFGEYSTWYLLEGQEELLKDRIEELFLKIREFKERLKEALENI
ncbi:MAG: helix-turn-helix domain-containing protein [Candidatus Aenigmatarchaeota archaeon]